MGCLAIVPGVGSASSNHKTIKLIFKQIKHISMSEMVYFSSKTNVLVVLFKKLFLFTSKLGKKGCEVEVFHSKQ